MKNKFYNYFSAIILVFALGVAEASAVENIAIIDIEKISQQAKVVKDVAGKVSKKRDQFQKEITSQEEKLEAERKKIEAKKSILSEEALDKQQKDFFKKVEELKKFAEKRDASLKKAYSEAIKTVNEEVGVIVSEIAKEKGLSLVIPASQVVFSVDNLDITAEVIKRLDKKVSKASVKFE